MGLNFLWISSGSSARLRSGRMQGIVDTGRSAHRSGAPAIRRSRKANLRHAAIAIGGTGRDRQQQPKAEHCNRQPPKAAPHSSGVRAGLEAG